MSVEIANLLFPNIPDFAEIVAKYPKRAISEDAIITRCPPSPTGELHIGTLFNALVNSQVGIQSGGICILRIEDTDKDREVAGSETRLIKNLQLFGINFPEGATLNGETGTYGPYRQSQRLDIYLSAAKYLVEKGFAYPCFLSEQEIDALEISQKQHHISRTGVYGDFALYRDSSANQVKDILEKGTPFQIRFKAPNKITTEWDDAVMGKQLLKDQEINDFVLLRRDQTATYRLANVIDDRLMGVSLIIRDNLWLDQTPSQIMLWNSFNWTHPTYAHYAPIAKLDPETGNKRKLSKRKDPEASIEYYIKQGYPTEGILSFITNLANSKFEKWREENPTRPAHEYVIDIYNLPSAPPLFDPIKLEHDSREAISQWSPEKLYEEAISWSTIHDPELLSALSQNPQYTQKVFAIERIGETSRKDLAKLDEIKPKYSMFFNDLFTNSIHEKISTSNVSDTQTITEVLSSFLQILPTQNITKEEWVNKVRELSVRLNFAPNRKEYKANPTNYKGDFANIMQLARIAITGSSQSPDLFEVISVLGTKVVQDRLYSALQWLGQ